MVTKGKTRGSATVTGDTRDTKITFRLRQDLRDVLADLAAADNRSLSQLVEKILIDYVRTIQASPFALTQSVVSHRIDNRRAGPRGKK